MRTERDWRSRARRPEPTGRGRRLRGDGGAIMAEAALLTPFFITLVFGMLEFGGAWRAGSGTGGLRGSGTGGLRGGGRGREG